MNNLDDLVASLAADAGPIKPAPHPFTLTLSWGAAATLYLLLSLWISGLRPDLLQKMYEPLFAVEIFMLLLIFISTSLSAALLAFPDLYQMRKTTLIPVAIFALFLVVLWFAWRADMPAAPHPVHDIECTLSITLFSVLPAIWTLLTMRRFATLHSRWAGAIGLLSAFSVGALWLRLHEQTDSINHILLWHYLPMLGIALLGWWLGKRLLKWSGAPLCYASA